jgi:hypothetical protein
MPNIRSALSLFFATMSQIAMRTQTLVLEASLSTRHWPGAPPASERVRRIAGCYLLHFDRKVHGAQHYLGWSVHIARRLRQHLRGVGARLVRQALGAGVGVTLVRVWTSVDRKQERALKARTPKSYCPRCHPKLEPVSAEVLVLLKELQPKR